MKRELFFQTHQPVEVRTSEAESGPASTITGYAAVFNEVTDLYYFKERIAPGAFTRTLKQRPDVRALFDHDTGMPIGRVANNTLTLEEDSHGLKVEITPPNTTAGRDALEAVRSGLVTGMSFGFRVMPEGAEWDLIDGEDVRTLTDVDLFEVSVVTFPAYEATEASARSTFDLYVDPRLIAEERRASKQDRERAIRHAFHERMKKRIAWYEQMI